MLGKLFKHTTTTAASAPCTGQRMFSRADIIKGLDKSKISRRAFIKKELTENPEFFKAFPHMQVVLAPKVEKEETSSKKVSGEENLADNAEYHEDMHLGFKDPSGKPEAGYFESLLHHHNHNMAPREKEEIHRQNEKNIVDAYESPTGPFKWLSSKELN